MSDILIAALVAALIVGVVGIILGFFLGISGDKLKVEVDEREDAILEVLPGNNCGGCGYAGCSALASAIVKGEAPCNQCPVGGATVAKLVAGIMGENVDDVARKVAFVKCSGKQDVAKQDYNYVGIHDCRAMQYVPAGGPWSCESSCLGYGSCVKACPFHAIEVHDGLAVVNKEACKACGKCVSVCPQKLIELIPYDATTVVRCSNKHKGKEVMAVCSAGCIACHLCEKTCEHDAVHVIDNIAYIDQEKCTGCGACAEKCPKKVIIKLKE